MSERAFRRLALLAAAAATAHGLLYIPVVRSNVNTDSPTYAASAEAILHGHYSTPLKAGFIYIYPRGFFDLTELRIPEAAWAAPERQAYRPPGYPAFLALFGGGGRGVSRWLALVAQAVLLGAGTWLLALTVRRWWGPKLGLAAAGLYALDPYSKHYVALILSDALAGFVLIAGLYVFTRAWERGTSPWWWAAAGALAGALTLVRVAFVLVVPLVVLAAALRRWRCAGAALACAIALLAPWLAWTGHVTGSPVLADWGEGYNLLVGAYGEGLGRTQADVARDPAFVRDFHSTHALAPRSARLVMDADAHPRYLERADARLRSLAWARYRHRLADEPQEVAWETLYRAYFLWNAHKDWYQPAGAKLLALRVVDWILLGLALAGAALALREGGPARAVTVFLLAYTAVLAVHHVEARFAIPARGAYLALVALALGRAVTAVRRKTQIQNTGAAGLPADVR